jgi:hypothetical protein
VDPEGAHRGEDREELKGPAKQLEGAGDDSRSRLPHHGKAMPQEAYDLPDGVDAAEVGDAVVAGAQHCGREQQDPGDDHRDQARHRPLGDVRSDHHEDDQADRGDEVENSVSEDRP